MKQVSLNAEKFQEMEKTILNQVLTMSKAMIETFKFKMIYGMNVSSKQEEKTLKDIKEFRTKNWDSKTNTKEAYKKYLGTY